MGGERGDAGSIERISGVEDDALLAGVQILKEGTRFALAQILM